jgi:hypothetical protein
MERNGDSSTNFITAEIVSSLRPWLTGLLNHAGVVVLCPLCCSPFCDPGEKSISRQSTLGSCQDERGTREPVKVDNSVHAASVSVAQDATDLSLVSDHVVDVAGGAARRGEREIETWHGKKTTHGSPSTVGIQPQNPVLKQNIVRVSERDGSQRQDVIRTVYGGG